MSAEDPDCPSCARPDRTAAEPIAPAADALGTPSRGGWLLLLLAVGVAIALLRGCAGSAPAAGDPLALVPADAVAFLHLGDEPARAAAAAPLWQPGRADAVRDGLRTRIAAVLAAESEEVSRREVIDLLDHTERAAVAWAPGDGEEPAWILLLSLESPEAARRAFTSVSPAETRSSPGGAQAGRLARRGGGRLHVASAGAFLLVTPDAGLLRFAVDASTAPRASLAGLPGLPAAGERALPWAVLDPAGWRRLADDPSRRLRPLPERLGLLLDTNLLADARPEARLLLTAQSTGEGFRIEGRWINAHSGGTSLLGSLLSGLGWLLLALVSLPLLFFAASLLLALYFWISAARLGRVSALRPPTLPPLSAGSLEDLEGPGAKPTAPADAPPAGEDDDVGEVRG